MNPKITKKEHHFKKSFTNSEFITNALKKGVWMITNNANYAVHKQEMLAADQKIIDNFKDQTIETQTFRLHDFVGEMRLSKSSVLDENKQKRFQIDSSRLLVHTNQEFFTNHRMMSDKVKIKRTSDNHPLIIADQINFPRNTQKIKKVLVDQALQLVKEKFFTSTKFYTQTKFFSQAFAQLQIQKAFFIKYNQLG